MKKQPIGFFRRTSRTHVWMGKKKDRPIDVNNMTPDEKLKFEVAEEIGCAQKVLEGGWRSLSAKESGRIGGILNKRKRQMRAELEAAAARC